MQIEVTDLLLIGFEVGTSSVVNTAQVNNYNYKIISDINDLHSQELSARLILLSSVDENTSMDEMVQLVRQQFFNSDVIVLVDKFLSNEQLNRFKKLGIRTVFLKSELGSAKLDYAITNSLKSKYIPIKASDLVVDQTVLFDVYHLLSYQKKYITLFKNGDMLDKDRIVRRIENSEFYIKSEDLLNFKKYAAQDNRHIGDSLIRKSRANYLVLQQEFYKMCLELDNQSYESDYKIGQGYIFKCRNLCAEISSNFQHGIDAGDVINKLSQADVDAVELAPAVAIYAGMLANALRLKRVDDIMMLSLFSYIGFLDLKLDLVAKIRKMDDLTVEDRKILSRAATKSIDKVLACKVGLDEKQRATIEEVYEDIKELLAKDPKKRSFECQLVKFAKELVLQTAVVPGRTRVRSQEAIELLLQDPKLVGLYSSEFIYGLNNINIGTVIVKK